MRYPSAIIETWPYSRWRPASSRSELTSTSTWLRSSVRWPRLPVAALGWPISPKEPCQGTPASTSSPSTGTAGTSYELPWARWPSTRAASDLGRGGLGPSPSGAHKPHNSAYVIDDGGQVVDRYDKRFCSGDANEKMGDLAHYSPGDHFSVWDIDGVRCGALICYDYRFPELHRQYKKLGAELVFHSFHAGNISPQRLAEIEERIGPELRTLNPAPTHTYPGITMPAAMTAAAVPTTSGSVAPIPPRCKAAGRRSSSGRTG